MLVLYVMVLCHFKSILKTLQNAFQVPGSDFGGAHAVMCELRSVYLLQALQKILWDSLVTVHQIDVLSIPQDMLTNVVIIVQVFSCVKIRKISHCSCRLLPEISVIL